MAHNAHATNGDQMFAMSAAQAGMGGATVAQAQDAVTVLVNPAGMADLGITDVRMDLGFGLLNPPREVNGQESDSDWYMMRPAPPCSTSTTSFSSAWDWAAFRAWG